MTNLPFRQRSRWLFLGLTLECQGALGMLLLPQILQLRKVSWQGLVLSKVCLLSAWIRLGLGALQQQPLCSRGLQHRLLWLCSLLAGCLLLVVRGWWEA